MAKTKTETTKSQCANCAFTKRKAELDEVEFEIARDTKALLKEISDNAEPLKRIAFLFANMAIMSDRRDILTKMGGGKA